MQFKYLLILVALSSFAAAASSFAAAPSRIGDLCDVTKAGLFNDGCTKANQQWVCDTAATKTKGHCIMKAQT